MENPITEDVELTREKAEESSRNYEEFLNKTEPNLSKAQKIRLLNDHRQIIGLPPLKIKGEKFSIPMTYQDLEQEFSQGIEWLWREHIPCGLPCMVNGREGVGKTSICLQIAKEILEANTKGSIVWLATEGFVRDTFDKMKHLNLTHDDFFIPKKSDGAFRFNLMSQSDLREIDNLLEELPQPILAVFVDSLRGATGLDENDSKIRIPMQALNSIICDRYRAALIYIHHFKKGQGGDLLDKSSGSPAITAAVRQVLSVLRETGLVRRIKIAKSNLNAISTELRVIKIDNKLKIVEATAQSEDTQVDRAEEFLTHVFANTNRIRATIAYSQAEDEGITSKPLKTAKQKLGIESKKDGDTWYWIWPIMG